MDSYLAKPVSKDALLALVGRLVRHVPVAPALSPPAVLDPEVAHAIDPVVFGELRTLDDATDEDLLAELVEQFVQETEPLLADLRAALDIGDALAVGRIAHGIKGSCVQLGGRRLALSCGRLERKAAAGSLAEGQDDLLEVEIDYKELRTSLTEQLTPVGSPQPRRLHA